MMVIIGLRDGLFLCLCLLIHFVYRRRQKRLLPLPPSIPGWPIVGNAFQLPLKYVHIFYRDLGRKLESKIMYVEAVGQPIIIINDPRMASDLLEKRSALYSSRPRLPMFEIIGTDQFFAILPHGDEWRNQRRMFQQYFSKRALPREQEKALEFTRKALLPNLYQTPQDFRDHISEYVGGMALSMTYGLPVKRIQDPLVKLSDDAFHAAMLASTPGKYLVNVFPFLKHLPNWLPGTQFKQDACQARKQLLRTLEEPFQAVQKNMEEGTASECFVSATVEKYKNTSDYEILEPSIKKNSISGFRGSVTARILVIPRGQSLISPDIGASETTVVALNTFVLAMLVHPEIQRKVQDEIDLVVGTDCLPDYSHRQQLPYLTAVLKEVLRWNPVLPTGVPHLATADDVYEGYYIPKGAAIMANAYAMLHDEEVFPNPQKFNPDRFIKDGVLVEDILDPTVVATFGFGRRICPGSHIALSTLYIATASILSLFDILPAHDANNNSIEVKPEFIDALVVSEPLPFPCKITPRPGRDIDGLLAGNIDFDFI